MKNLFYWEQEARQVLELDYKELAFECEKHMELRIASDYDLINCYKSLATNLVVYDGQFSSRVIKISS
jgi:hypothetical protein